MDHTPPSSPSVKLLRNPTVDVFFRACASIVAGGALGFAAFVGFVSTRVNIGRPPLPEAPLPLVLLSVAVGLAASVTFWLLHSEARRRASNVDALTAAGKSSAPTGEHP